MHIYEVPLASAYASPRIKCTYSAHQGVEHDDMNVLVMGSRIIGYALAFDIVTAYLAARFQRSEERFVRRLNKLKKIEQHYMRAGNSQSRDPG